VSESVTIDNNTMASSKEQEVLGKKVEEVVNSALQVTKKARLDVFEDSGLKALDVIEQTAAKVKKKQSSIYKKAAKVERRTKRVEAAKAAKALR